MSRFLKQLAWFSIGILCANALLWILSRQVLFADYRQAFIRVARAQPQAILLGDSHVEALGHTNIDERILNLGFASDSPPDMLVKLRYACEKQPNLRYVLVQADDHMLNGYRDQLNNRKRVVEFCTLQEYRESYGGGAGRYFREKYLENYFPIIAVDRSPLFQRLAHKTFGKCFRLALGRSKPRRPAADDWSLLTPAQRQEGANDRVQKHYTSEQTAQLEMALRKIVEMARDHGKEIVGVIYPLVPEYRQLTGARFKGRPVANILRAEGVAVVDFSSLYDARPELFKDADHLNTRGAQAFSQHLSALLETNSTLNRMSAAAPGASP